MMSLGMDGGEYRVTRGGILAAAPASALVAGLRAM